MDRRRLLTMATIGLIGAAACSRDNAAPSDVTRPDPPPPDDAPPSDPSTPSPDPSTPSPDRDITAPGSGDPEPDVPDVPDEPDDEPALRLEIICRDALGLAAAGGGAVPHQVRSLMLHHTAVPLSDNRQAPAQLRGHQQAHVANGWPDIAYHYGIDLAGNVYELRDPATAGDTGTDYDPTGHLLVVCEGDYDRDEPTDAMLAAVAAVLAHGAQHHGVGLDTLSGHRDHAATACPGDGLHRRLDEIAAEATRLLDPRPQVDLVCGQAGRDRIAAIEAG